MAGAVDGQERGLFDLAHIIFDRRIEIFENAGRLDRAVEGLADNGELLRRGPEGRGLTRPELAVLLATAKLALKAGATKAAKLSFTVPAELPAGTYFVSTRLDGTAINDTNAANNDSVSTTTITIA